MKILDAHVRDMPALGWGNPPHLQILVDHHPTWEEITKLVHKTKGANSLDDLSGEQMRIINHGLPPAKSVQRPLDATAYLAEQDGYIHYFLHNPRNETGFGGSVFKGLLEDGTEFSVKGPWSSNPEVMRKYFGLDIVHVSMTDDPEVLVRGYTYSAGDITLELAKQAIPFLLPDFTITDIPPYLTRLTPMIPQYPEGSPNWHKREYQRKQDLLKGGGTLKVEA